MLCFSRAGLGKKIISKSRVQTTGSKTSLFEPCIYIYDLFTKTGSGQTQGKLRKEAFIAPAAGPAHHSEPPLLNRHDDEIDSTHVSSTRLEAGTGARPVPQPEEAVQEVHVLKATVGICVKATRNTPPFFPFQCVPYVRPEPVLVTQYSFLMTKPQNKNKEGNWSAPADERSRLT